MRDNAYSFAQSVASQIEALSRDEFFLRVGRSKRLQEELFPLSRLALHFAFPGLSVEVEAFENNGPVDGHISLRGYKTQDFDVEITYLRSHEDAMRGELLCTNNVTPGAGPIRRDKVTGEVIAEYGLIEHCELIETIASSLIDLHAKKVVKTYPLGTVLLIAFDEVSLYGSSDWRKLYDHLASKGGLAIGKFRAIYLFNCATNELQTAA